MNSEDEAMEVFSTARRGARNAARRSTAARSIGCEPLEPRTLLSGNSAGSSVLGTVVDRLGDTYLVGSFRGTVDFDPGPAVVNLTSRGGSDAFLVKLDPAGGIRWAKAFGSTGNDAARAIAVNPLGGQLLVVGNFSGTLALDPTDPAAVLTAAGGQDGFFAIFDADGNDLLARSFGAGLADGINAIAVDLTGTVYVGGEFTGTVDFDLVNGGKMLTSTGRAGRTDGFIAAYDLTGNCLWARGIGAGKDDAVFGLAVSPAGLVVAVGEFEQNVDFDPGPGVVRRASQGDEDGFVLALNRAGEHRWSFTVGSREDDAVRAVACDAAGNVFIGGEFEKTVDFDPSSRVTTLRSQGDQDGFVAKYSPEGRFAWARGFGSPDDDGIFAVAADVGGGVVAGGRRHVAVTTTTTGSNGRPQTRVRWREAGYAVKLEDSGRVGWSASFLTAAVGATSGDRDDGRDDRETRKRRVIASTRDD